MTDVRGYVVDGRAVEPPAGPDPEPVDPDRPAGAMAEIAAYLGAEGPTMRNLIEAAVTAPRAEVKVALDYLMREGHVEVDIGPRRAKFYRFVRPDEADPGDETP
jgi:hypothetical protein